jgi:hypothetical protein
MSVSFRGLFQLLAILSLLMLWTSVFAQGVGANFAGSTSTQAAAVMMDGGWGHISDSGQASPKLVSTQDKSPGKAYSYQVFQRQYSRLQGDLRSKQNQAILARIAKMYIEVQEYNRKNGREIKIDVLTVQAIGKNGVARSQRFAAQIFEALKKNDVKNLSLDPEPRERIPMPPSMVDLPPVGKT